MLLERHTTDSSSQRLMVHGILLLCLIMTISSLWGCEKLNAVFQRTHLPDMGPRLANSVKLTFDPSFINLKMQYIDGCNSPHEFHVGEEIESIIIDAASQNFTAVTIAGETTASIQPDTEIVFTLQRSSFKLWTDTVYDRVPADMVVETLLTFKDAAGKDLGQQTVSITQHQRLILETSLRRCNYSNIEEFVHDAGIALSTQFIRVARIQLAGTGGTTPTPGTMTSSMARADSTTATFPANDRQLPLSFKATALDENSDLIFEGGERIRVRIDLM